MRTFQLCSIAAAVLTSTCIPVSMAANIVVDSSSDAVSIIDKCTLRDAIRSANGDLPLGGCTKSEDDADVISFDFTASSETIVLVQGELEVTQSLTIQGGSTQEVVLDARSQNRILNVSAGALFIENLSVRSGSANTLGGCINLATDKPARFLNLSATSCYSPSGGGAIAVSSSVPTVEILDSTIIANSSTRGGGLISGSPRLTILDSVISENSASRGAGVFIEPSSAVEITSSSIKENNSSRSGGGVYLAFASLVVFDSSISRNQAFYGAGVLCYSAQCDFDETNLRDNVAFATATLFNSGRGAAIHANRSTVTVNAGTINENTATSVGGGIFVTGYTAVGITGDAVLKYNESSQGGAIALDTYGASLNISNAQIRGNTASGSGGGISIVNTMGANYENSISITNTLFNKNYAEDGGALSNRNPNFIVIESSAFEENSAEGSGSLGDGAGIHLRGGSLSLINSYADDNEASGDGGFLLARSNASVNMVGSRIENSIARGRGAGVHLSESSMAVSQSSVTGNYSEVGTGGFYVYESELALANSTVADNSALAQGGAITLYGSSSLSARHVTLTGNSGAAGAISGQSNNVEVSFLANTVIANNSLPQCDEPWPGVDGNWGEDASCFGIALGDPLLNELSLEGIDNQTRIRTPQDDSPLIGAANTRFCQGPPVLGLDQLGRIRDSGPCTIGAYESIEPTFFYTVPTKNGKTVVFGL